MSVEFVSYEDKYLEGIVECLRRNFDWMADRDGDYLKKWISPILYYTWKEDECLKNLPYLQGLVILDADQVVGYFGVLYSVRSWKNQSVICANPTTWMLDEPYRLHMFRAIKMIFQGADVVVDFTPRKSVAEVLEKVFKFQYYERECVRLYPVPYLCEDSIELRFLSADAKGLDISLRKEYLDHSFREGIGFVFYCTKNSNEKGYIIYRVMPEGGKWIRILKVTNKPLFARHAHEIIWKILRRECYDGCADDMQALCRVMELMQDRKRVCVECDRNFFGGETICHPLYRGVEVRRMILNKTDLEIENPDMLYSELAVLL